MSERKARALLAYLALNPEQHHGRDKLAALLWGARADTQARSRLSKCLSGLRKAVGNGAEALLDTDRDGVILHGAAIEVDVAQLRRLAESDDLEDLAEAASLYDGELLAGIATSEEAYEEWLFFERQALHKTAIEVLSKLAGEQLGNGDAEAAATSAEKLVALDPLNERAHRILMRANVSAGRRNAALQQYRTCVETLRQELGVEPEAATKAIYEWIMSGDSDRGSPDVFPNNLPTSVSSFVGRKTEIAELVELLGTTRLLTLVGTGGSGKTRLCLEVAAQVLGEFSEGVWIVELAGLTDPALVPRQVAWSLGLSEKAGRKWSEVLGAFVSDRELLLILDNCEHLIRAAADLTMDLLLRSPKLRVLATSREILNLPGEVTWQIPLLSTPSNGESTEIDDLMGYESVQLFVERTRAVRADAGLREEDAGAVAQICRRLDGVPLALELAAALVRTLSVQQIVRHLDDRFSLLTGGSRAALPRRQTLRATVSWS